MSLAKYFVRLIVAITAFTASIVAEAAQDTQKQEKILIVVSSLDKKTENLVGGFWFPELTHPVKVFDKAGLDFDIASPKGGLAPFDGFDLKDQASLDFWTNPRHRNKLGQTIKLSDIDPSKYSAILRFCDSAILRFCDSAILLVGGHGPMWDFVNNAELSRIVRAMYENNDIISAVCHGPAGLINVKLSNGENLIKGRRLTGFTAEEEVSRQYDKIVPFELESALEKGGARFEQAPIFENKVVVDGRLITGQNPASATALGEAVVKALQARTR
ncbi:type 1 glutamine amidotransferase domain-containing protein [Dickeya fangzhongdai]|uniref:type 1 glutamine amidotransferase domain-containing protein n=1 Tax=Dickeya fangzhongdai TaxID=1778540 RepID=UPI001EFB58E1|nr:type 1 glutamine amidotransferase domain-containing protein [Dickeya fangzhongdai]ULR29211.1 type 1 glutamine amidotransferase domain-containing protein [Dickeya fangzhongdai]